MFKVLIVVVGSAFIAFNLIAALELKTKSCKCFVVAHDLASIEKCFVKAISRNTSTLNVIAKLNKTFVAPIYVDVRLSYRYGNIFREAIKVPRFEWCGAVRDMSVSPYLSHFFEALRYSAPQVFQPCPYKKGYLNYTDLNFDPERVQLFPSGTYRGELNVTAGDVFVGYGWAVFEITSELKHSFG